MGMELDSGARLGAREWKRNGTGRGLDQAQRSGADLEGRRAMARHRGDEWKLITAAGGGRLFRATGNRYDEQGGTVHQAICFFNEKVKVLLSSCQNHSSWLGKPMKSPPNQALMRFERIQQI